MTTLEIGIKFKKQEKLLELYKEYFEYSEILKDGREFDGRMLVEHERDKIIEEIKELENEKEISRKARINRSRLDRPKEIREHEEKRENEHVSLFSKHAKTQKRRGGNMKIIEVRSDGRGGAIYSKPDPEQVKKILLILEKANEMKSLKLNG